MPKSANNPYPFNQSNWDSSRCEAIQRLDPWVVSSLLQKAIRRNDINLSLAAGHRLFQLRGNAIWHRLLTIAVEDIGIASTQNVVLAADYAKLARHHLDPRTVLTELITVLSNSAKCRGSDYAICAAADHPELEQERRYVGTLTDAQRVAVATSGSEPLMRRAIAAWFSSGLDYDDERRVTTGTLERLLSAFADRGMSITFLEAVQFACRKIKHPICIMLPVLLDASSQSANTCRSSKSLDMPAALLSNGVPAYAYDKHTAKGKAAIARFAIRNSDTSRTLSKYVPDYHARDAALMAAFYTDAVPITPKFTWHETVTLEKLGCEADFAKVGFPAHGIDELLSAFQRNIDHLNMCRDEQVSSNNAHTSTWGNK